MFHGTVEYFQQNSIFVMLLGLDYIPVIVKIAPRNNLKPSIVSYWIEMSAETFVNVEVGQSLIVKNCFHVENS